MPTPLSLLDGLRWDGRPVPGERMHVLLAALALAAPRSVPVADLIEDLWPDEQPEHPEKALQVLVSRTRSRTVPHSIALERNGYRLGLREDEVDALRLRRLVAEARAAHDAGDLDVARLGSRDALAVAVARPVGDTPVARLTRSAAAERSAASRLLGRVLLARGEVGEALPLLEMARAEDPADEDRLVDVLRAEAVVRGVPAALARYGSFAGEVRERVGAEPGPALRRLHAELLARDAPVREGLAYEVAPMIGRDDDVAAIRGLLGVSRVVSIVGAGGLGKTRMANLVGRLAEQPVVHLVELAGVTSADGVVREVAGALGVRDSVASVRTATLRSDLRGRIAEHLDRAPTLVVLDNCEHLIGAVADLVAFLVATVESTRVLTTSRAPLGIAAEQVYLLPQLGQDDAVELFGQRARAARADMRLDPAEVRALAGRLDGLPLAIELAAAKVRVMAVTEISRRLADRFALLTGRDRSAPERHQTLEAVIAWSWNLLGEADQEALRTLAVFPDGFSMESASAVLGRDALEPLAELVDQSLLVVREGDQVRYRFLETVREYGLRQLAVSGGTDEVRARLLAWATSWARAAATRLYSPEQVETMTRVRGEAGNLAGVLRAALDDHDAVALVPLIAALGTFWTIEGDHLAVLSISDPVLEQLVRAPDPEPEHAGELRGVLAALVINTTIFTGHPPVRAVVRLRELGLAGDGGREDALACVLAAVYPDPYGPPDRAALDRLCDDPDDTVAVSALQWSAQFHENAGDVVRATAAIERAMGLCSDAGGPWTRALLESQACGLAAQAGDWEQSVTYACHALPVMEAVGAVEDAIQLRSVIAMADIVAGRLDEAQAGLDAIATVDTSGQAIGWAVAGLTGQAELALARQDVGRGLALYRQCLALALERRFHQLDGPTNLMPWVLFAQSSALIAHVLNDRVEEGRDLVDGLRDAFPDLMADTAKFEDFPAFADFPVLGGVLVGFGLWLLGARPAVGADVRAAAVRLVAVGHRFGYNRSLPTLAWVNVRTPADAAEPGVLDDLVAEYAGRPAEDLREVAREAIAVAEGYMARR